MQYNVEMAALCDVYHVCSYYFDGELIERKKRGLGIEDQMRKAERYIKNYNIKVPECYRAFFTVEIGKSFVFECLLALWLDEMTPLRILEDDLINQKKMSEEFCNYYGIRMDSSLFDDVKSLIVSDDVKESILHICYNFSKSLIEVSNMLKNMYNDMREYHNKKNKQVNKVYTKLCKNDTVQKRIKEAYPNGRNIYYYISMINDYVDEANYNSYQGVVNFIGGEYSEIAIEKKTSENKVKIESIIEVLNNKNRRNILEYISNKGNIVSQSELCISLNLSMSTVGSHTSVLAREKAIFRVSSNDKWYFVFNDKYMNNGIESLIKYMRKL